MTRRESREQAFVLLFEKEFNPELGIDEIISRAREAQLAEIDDFAACVANTATDNRAEIDSIIESNSIGWRVDRLPKVALSLLRLALAEMKYIDNIPVSVSINEAVELAKIYATPEDASFINGILGTVARASEK
ncbi:MAG: transcription antitermination factor NusB [Clostridiales bacterium]|nr:transcription antitermination factor NusB [Clostridiales bacterium]